MAAVDSPASSAAAADSLKLRPSMPRRKFATPPVKVACLSCRASRTRCDGGTPCASCVNKRNECIYRPSRRGGPRVRKKAVSPEQALRSDPEQDAIGDADPSPQEPLPLQNYVDPGAGLRQLHDGGPDSDFMFDSLFMGDVPDLNFGDMSMEAEVQLSPPSVPIVRMYRTDRDILEAYYIWIHPFLPILPPPETSPHVDRAMPVAPHDINELGSAFEPLTPLTLAISAILALIPCAEDTNHTSMESIVTRRKHAHRLAQAAMEAIETEHEIPSSSIEPSRALDQAAGLMPNREALHPRLPIELESIVALDILSVYEYGQRGNLRKMQSRATQAFASAMMNFSLHCRGAEDDYHAEARRRVWWMTFICMCQACIVSNSMPKMLKLMSIAQSPSFNCFSPDFTTKYPTLDADPEAWGALIHSQQAILAATEFVIARNKAVKAHADMGPVCMKMRDLETYIAPLVEDSEKWDFSGPLTVQVDTEEHILARSLKAMARIKLNSARIKVHRYCAFYDAPVFSSKHCDLRSTNETTAIHDPRIWPSCGCSPITGCSPASSIDTASSAAHSAPASTTAGPVELAAPPTASSGLPFSAHVSAKVCLRSALSIAQGFENLPYPNPLGGVATGAAGGPEFPFLSATSSVVAPRTMPSFACCAMQGAYSLLMIHQRTTSLYPTTGAGGGPAGAGGGSAVLVSSMLVRLQQGLTSISAVLENYATAFEALGGMRDQIRLAVDTSRVFDA